MSDKCTMEDARAFEFAAKIIANKRRWLQDAYAVNACGGTIKSYGALHTNYPDMREFRRVCAYGALYVANRGRCDHSDELRQAEAFLPFDNRGGGRDWLRLDDYPLAGILSYLNDRAPGAFESGHHRRMAEIFKTAARRIIRRTASEENSPGGN